MELGSQLKSAKLKNFDSFLSLAQMTLNEFKRYGYTVSAEIVELPLLNESANKKMYQLRIQAPANLWSLTKLAYEKNVLVNDFESKVLAHLAKTLSLELNAISRSRSSLEIMQVLECTQYST